jgi:multiple sugar transport system substrate-binding protein
MAEQVVPGLRIPEADDYLADLTQGRSAAMNGEPVEKALEGVAARWAKRTAALGPKRQAWHYRKSLNLPTALEPPPRGQ